jgi:hypothetical protein
MRMKPDAFKDFDTSYWQPKNKLWMAEREQQWREIEKFLYGKHKGKKATAIIKRYFFKGTLPDWEKLENWDNEDGHLDLMLFLYLHPSQDEEVLRPLRDAYMSSYQVKRRDIMAGLRCLIDVGETLSCNGGEVLLHSEDVEKNIPHLAGELKSLPPQGKKPNLIYYKELVLHTQGNSERLFSLMCPDLKQRSFQLPGEWHETLMPTYGYRNLWEWGKWLILTPPLNLGAQDMLFQYDLPLETWYNHCGQSQDEYDAIAQPASRLKHTLIALYRIHNFDQQAEGDSPRTRFVRKVTGMLDEREFVPAFKAIWEHVKNGGVEVKDPWTYDGVVVSSALLNATRGAG